MILGTNFKQPQPQPQRMRHGWRCSQPLGGKMFPGPMGIQPTEHGNRWEYDWESTKIDRNMIGS